MLSKFLKKNEVNRLKVLASLSDDKLLTFKNIQEITGTPPTTANRIITELNQNLGDLVNNSAQITIDDYTYRFENNSNYSFSEISKMIYYDYLEHSINFNIFIRVLSEKHINILNLCSKINISQSYCYSKIVEINETIEEYQIKLKTENHIVSLEGEETAIVFFTFLVYKFLQRAQGLDEVEPSTENYRLFIKQITNKKEINAMDISTVKAIYDTASFRNNHIKDIRISNDNVREILTLIKSHHDIFSSDISLNIAYPEDFNLFYNFLVRAFISDVDCQEFRIEIGKKLTLLKDNELINNQLSLMNGFIHSMNAKALKKEENSYFEVFYLLSLHICYIDLVGADFKTTFKEFQRNEIFDFTLTDISEVENEIHTLVGEYSCLFTAWSDVQKTAFTNLMTKLLYGYLFSHASPTLNILVDIPGYLFTEYLLKKQLLSYFSADLIHFVTSVDQANLVITDQITSLPKDVTLFYFFDLQSEKLWKELFLVITNMSFNQQTKNNNVNQINNSLS